jgi:hypothetical protein
MPKKLVAPQKKFVPHEAQQEAIAEMMTLRAERSR